MTFTSSQAALLPHMQDDEIWAHFRSGRRQFNTQGIAATLPAGPMVTLGERVRAFFAAKGASGPDLLLGALPFDGAQHDHLIQPQQVTENIEAPPVAADIEVPARWTVRSEPDAAGYGAMVARALDVIAQSGASGLGKVVLARRLLLEADRAIDSRAIAARLGGDRSVTTFAMPLPPAADGTSRSLVGGTPELLLAKTGRSIRSNPLAGSARRQPDPQRDEAAAAELLASDKNRREHAAVVEAILDTLAPYCEELSAPKAPALQSTASMWHLGTQIEGRLRDDSISGADLVAQLHPTPAVCGFPRDRAQRLIGELEPFERGFYAGAVGWVNGAGDGEWHIALRCGEISGRKVTLYAGAGIVLGSDPMAEAAETSAKFVALLQALGIDENGNALPGGRA